MGFNGLKGKNHPLYKDGRYNKQYYCLGCWKPISRHSGLYGQGRCKSCAMKGNLNNRNYQGGRIKTSDGHIAILMPTHPYKSFGHYVYEHRLVMEYKLGRYLKHTEIVHHLNGIKDDNRPENLGLMLKDKHTRIHVKNRTTYLHLLQKRIRTLETQLNAK